MAQITDPDYMDIVVKRSRNLVWDGWDVLKTKRHPLAYFYKDGRFIAGRWYRTRRFRLTEKGWNIPDGFVKA